MDALWTPSEKQAVDGRLRYAIVGSPETVRRKLAEFIEMTGVRRFLQLPIPTSSPIGCGHTICWPRWYFRVVSDREKLRSQRPVGG